MCVSVCVCVCVCVVWCGVCVCVELSGQEGVRGWGQNATKSYHEHKTGVKSYLLREVHSFKVTKTRFRFLRMCYGFAYFTTQMF